MHINNNEKNNNNNTETQDTEEHIDTEAQTGENKDTDIEETDDDIVAEEELNTDAVKKLKRRLKHCQKERQEYLEGWQRAQADAVNQKKEHTQALSAAHTRAKEEMVEALLPVLDSFSMAFENKEQWEAVDANWRVGVENIYAQLWSALNTAGLEALTPDGETFDPLYHESVETVPAETKAQDGTVVAVVQQGYILGDRVVRPAKVKVAQVQQEHTNNK